MQEEVSETEPETEAETESQVKVLKQKCFAQRQEWLELTSAKKVVESQVDH